MVVLIKFLFDNGTDFNLTTKAKAEEEDGRKKKPRNSNITNTINIILHILVLSNFVNVIHPKKRKHETTYGNIIKKSKRNTKRNKKKISEKKKKKTKTTYTRITDDHTINYVCKCSCLEWKTSNVFNRRVCEWDILWKFHLQFNIGEPYEAREWIKNTKKKKIIYTRIIYTH